MFLIQSVGAALLLLLTLIHFSFSARSAHGAVNLPEGFHDEEIVSGLDEPVGFAFLPDGRIIIIEQNSGRLWLVVNGQLDQSGPLWEIEEVAPQHWERGLLGIAVDPEFPSRPYVYAYFSNSVTSTNDVIMVSLTGDLADGNSTALSVAASSRYLILQVPDENPQHNGGTLRFGPDGMLYVSLGEDHHHCEAQDLSTLNGRILRLDVSSLPGSGPGPPDKATLIPEDNPFAGSNNNARLTFCYGLRNPFRFNIDPVTGRLLIGDVGLDWFEEICLARGGENFGWPFREGLALRTWPECEEPGGPGGTHYEPPILAYDRTAFSPASILTGDIYRGAGYPDQFFFPPEYDGSVFYIEIFQGWMRRIVETDTGWVHPASVAGQPDEMNWATGFVRAADVQVGPDGALYYVRQVNPDIAPPSGALRRIIYYNPTLQVEPASVQFEVASARPESTIVTIANGGNGTFVWDATTALASSWLFIDPISGDPGQSMTIRVDPVGLSVGVYRDTVIVSAPDASNTPVAIPVTLSLESARIRPFVTPNPFNPNAQPASIQFYLEQAGPVTITVYDLTGEMVEMLYSGSRGTGWQVVEWNGSGVASGAYLCRILASQADQVVTIILKR